MQSRGNSLVILLLLILSLVPVGLSDLASPVHGSPTGLVCLATVLSSPPPDPCSSSFVFNGPVTNPSTELRVGVYIYNSTGLNGFDIDLLANHNILKPAGIDLAGSVLNGGGLILVECLSGVLVTGSTCLNSTDTVDTLHLAAVSSIGTDTGSPTTGLLFTAIYQVTNSTTSPISLSFQTGCNSSSDKPVCVTITNGTVLPVPESVQAAEFDNSTPPPYLAMISNSSSVGPMIVGSRAGLRLNLTGQNGWSNPSESCPCPASLTVLANNTVTVRLNTTSVMVPQTGSVFVGMNVTGGVGGNFTMMVLAEYQVLDLNNFNTDTLVAVVNVHLIVSDFSLTANPANVSSALAGMTSDSMISVVGYNGFSGTIHLSETNTAGQCSLSSTTVSLPGSASSQLSCTDPSAGDFNATVTGVSSGISHSVSIRFTVQDFTVSVGSSPTVLSVGSTTTVVLTVTGLNGFGQNVTVSLSPPSGLSISPISTTLIVPGSITLTVTASQAANYTIHVTFSYSGLTHNATFQVQVTSAVGGANAILGLSPSLFYSLIAGLCVIAVAVTYFFLRRRRRHVQTSTVSLKGPRPKKN